MKSGHYIAIWIIVLVAWAWPNELRPPLIDEQEFSIEQYQLQVESACMQMVQDSSLYTEGWDTLVQPLFWKRAMELPPDTIIVNIAKNRQFIRYLSLKEWHSKSEKQQVAYEDSLKAVYKLEKKDEIYFTTGRNHFYRFEEMLEPIDQAISVFVDENTDPWYAQAILLIESPGRLQYSTEGAYGAFQLMKGVAKDMGLIVNDTLDEREDFEKSAAAAARLIRTVCLPKARDLLNKYDLEYEEQDLWFRLFVMHVYHAGIGNVRRVVRRIKPKEGGQQLITTMWQTKGRRFGNASQNYSQIILACFLRLNELVAREGLICPVEREPQPQGPDTSPAPPDDI